jgi:hypothetical protein
LDDWSHSSANMAGWVRLGITHKNPSRRMTKVMPSIWNITIDMSYVIHPKYILFFYHFVNVSSNFYMTGHVHPCILYRFKGIAHEILRNLPFNKISLFSTYFWQYCSLLGAQKCAIYGFDGALQSGCRPMRYTDCCRRCRIPKNRAKFNIRLSRFKKIAKVLNKKL